jgi:hypothetical protein
MGGQRFEVVCVHCRRQVMIVRLIGTGEREQLRQH